MAVFRRDADARVHDEENRVGVLDRGFRLGAHAAGQRFAAALLQPRRVDDGEMQVAELGLAGAAVAGHPRLVVDQRQLLADEPVEQGRLADIRTADDGDGKLMSYFWRRFGPAPRRWERAGVQRAPGNLPPPRTSDSMAWARWRKFGGGVGIDDELVEPFARVLEIAALQRRKARYSRAVWRKEPLSKGAKRCSSSALSASSTPQEAGAQAREILPQLCRCPRRRPARRAASPRRRGR